MLPLGERVQSKVEKVIEKHMARLGMPSEIWQTSSCHSDYCDTRRLEGFAFVHFGSIAVEEDESARRVWPRGMCMNIFGVSSVLLD
jgi:hypothetical protein